MICSFGDRATEDLYHGRQNARVRRIPQHIRSKACRKLDMLEYAENVNDLRVPPGNRLEELKGNRDGFCSIRINDQWRIVFAWRNGAAHEVSIEDYHP